MGKRSKVRKSKLLSAGAMFVGASQALRYCFYVPLRPKIVAGREIRLSPEVTCFPHSCAPKTSSFQKAWWEGLINVSTLLQLCSLSGVAKPTCCPCSTQYKAPLLLYSQMKIFLQRNQFLKSFSINLIMLHSYIFTLFSALWLVSKDCVGYVILCSFQKLGFEMSWGFTP